MCAYIPGMNSITAYDSLVLNLPGNTCTRCPNSSFASFGAAADYGNNAVYIASYASAVTRIDTQTGALTNIPISHPAYGIACVPQTNRCYVSASDGGNDYLEVINTLDNTAQEYQLSTDSSSPTGVVASPYAAGSKIFVGTNGGRVYCIDAGTIGYELVELGSGAVNGLAVHPSGTWVYATFAPGGSVNGSVKRINAAACSVVETETISKPTGGTWTRPYGIALNHTYPSTDLTGYVTDYANNIIRLLTVTPTSLSLQSQYHYPPASGGSQPTGIAVSPDDKYMVVCLQGGGTGNGEVDEIDLPRWQALQEVPTNRPPICLGNFITPYPAM